MNVINYSDARARLKEVMDRAINDKEEVIVTRRNGEAVAVISLDTWNSIQETMHLMSSRKNAERLFAAIDQLDANEGEEQELIK